MKITFNALNNYLKLLLMLFCNMHPFHGYAKESKTRYVLKVGTYERTREHLEHFARLMMLMFGVPNKLEKEFMRIKKDSMEVLYMELLKKKCIIHAYSPKSIKAVKLAVQKHMDSVKDALELYQVSEFVAREFFTITLAFNQFLKTSNNLGAQINEKEITLTENEQNQQDYLEIHEIGLSKEHFKLEDLKAVHETLDTLLASIPKDLLTLMFSNVLSVKSQGNVGSVSIKQLDKKLLNAFYKSKDKYFVYTDHIGTRCLIVKKTPPKSKKMIENELMQFAVQEKLDLGGMHYSLKIR